MSFSEIIGQPELIARLGNALSGTPGHAYLLMGPTGSGRRMIARSFAKALLCFKPSSRGSCDQCDSCRHFDHGVHPDFFVLAAEGKEKLIKVEKVRRSACADVQMKPQMSGRKVYLIMADELNEQGQNALLKTLEEPPDYAVFLLVSVGSERLLPTIRSRVVPLVTARLSEADIIEVIRRSCDMDECSPDQLRFYARYAAGVPGAAISLLAQDWFVPLRGETADFYFQLASLKPADLLTDGYAFLETNKAHIDPLLAILLSLVRDELVYMKTGQTGTLVNQDLAPKIISHAKAKACRVEGLSAIANAIHLTRKALTFNVSFEISACQLLLVIRREFIHA